ncbi:MAG TPA: hypothetical protein VG889_14475 [Rhizomicrobium sp.]|nr:hypothetical protein [Rhizomicrobium sp.]
MTRVCLIGDSHLAALKLAWNTLVQEFPDFTLDFFAAPGKTLDGLSVSDGQLVPGSHPLAGSLKLTSGGKSTIAGDYDRYVIHGLELGVPAALEISRKYRAERHAKDWRTPISDDCYAEAVRGAARATLAGRTLVKLRAITTAPIFVCPTPMADARNQKIRQAMVETGEARDVVRLFVEGCERLARASEARFLSQPDETLEADGIGTKASLSSAPARFHAELAAKNDNSHMNTAYGEAVLRKALMAAA